MPTLPNPKHEAVLQAFIADAERVGWRAYQSVYTKSSQRASETAWSRLLSDAEFSARRDELLKVIHDQAVAAAAVKLEDVIAELARIGFANMLDYIRIDDGRPALDFSKLTREQASAIGELTQEERTEYDGEGEAREAVPVIKTKFKLHDKRAALESLRDHLVRHEPEKHEHTAPQFTGLELVRRIAHIMHEAKRAAQKPPAPKPAAAKPAAAKPAAATPSAAAPAAKGKPNE